MRFKLLTVRVWSAQFCTRPQGPRAASRRGVLLWEVDPARLGPALQELSLLGTCRAVGEAPNLDRRVSTGRARSSRAARCCLRRDGVATRSTRAQQCILPCSSRRSGACPASQPRDQRPCAAGSPDTARSCGLSWLSGSTTSRRSQHPTTCLPRPGRVPTRVHAHGPAPPPRAGPCGVDTLDRLEVTMPLAHLPAQRSKRAAFETERPIAPAAVPKVVAKNRPFPPSWPDARRRTAPPRARNRARCAASGRSSSARSAA